MPAVAFRLKSYSGFLTIPTAVAANQPTASALAGLIVIYVLLRLTAECLSNTEPCE